MNKYYIYYIIYTLPVKIVGPPTKILIVFENRIFLTYLISPFFI